MLDPITGWLSHVDALVWLAVSIFGGLALICHHIDHILGSVLSMCLRVSAFRQGRKGSPRQSAQAGGKVLSRKKKQLDRSAST